MVKRLDTCPNCGSDKFVDTITYGPDRYVKYGKGYTLHMVLTAPPPLAHLCACGASFEADHTPGSTYTVRIQSMRLITK